MGMSPEWLQELRDLLALADYKARKQAMQRWENRWTIDCHATQEFSPNHPRHQTHARERVMRDIGRLLATLMTEVVITDAPDDWPHPYHMAIIDVLAIRREPHEPSTTPD